MSLNGTLGFLGFGNMGQAIYHGLIAANTVRPGQVAVFDVDARKTALVAEETHHAKFMADLASRSDILILATKPQDMASALDQLAGAAPPDALYISIAAGIGIEFIQERLGISARVARAMPNTPALVGAGAAAIAFSETCTEADRIAAATIFEAIGIAETVPEDALDAVTALSGSGPAYFFYFVECLVNAAVESGIPEKQALRLAVQTAIGAGRMMAESGEPPAVLRDRVTSKGGTTFAALESLRGNDFAGIIEAAFNAAAARSKELGQ